MPHLQACNMLLDALSHLDVDDTPQPINICLCDMAEP